MATLEQLEEGIRRAHAAGNAEHVRVLGTAYRQMQAGQAQSAQASPAPSTPPEGAQPGTREYAQWAAQRARDQVAAGGRAELPQVSQHQMPESSILDPLVQGITFGWGDELRGAVQGGIAAAQGKDFGRTYDQVVDESRNSLDRERRVNPVGSFAAEVAGAIPTGMGVGGQIAGKGAGMLARVASGAAVGAAQGGVYGAGASDTDRLSGAAFGAGTGAVVGGAIPAVEQGFRSLFGRVGAVMPEIDDLYAAKNKAYLAVDQAGFRYSPQQYDGLVNDIYRRVGAEGIDPNPDGAHKMAINMLGRLNGRAAPTTLSEIDALRQVIRRDVIDSGSRADGHFGQIMLDAVDDFIEQSGGSGVIGAARASHRTLRKAELLADALERARLNAASSGSGGNIDNAMRQQIKSILLNPSRVRSFTPTERAMMKKIVEGGGSLQGILRLVGKLSPSGNGLMAALGVGATAANPMMAIPVGAGMAAKAVSDGATKAGVRALEQVVRTGGKLPPLPTAPGRLQHSVMPLVPYFGGKVGEAVGR